VISVSSIAFLITATQAKYLLILKLKKLNKKSLKITNFLHDGYTSKTSYKVVRLKSNLAEVFDQME